MNYSARVLKSIIAYVDAVIEMILLSFSKQKYLKIYTLETKSTPRGGENG